ncbi:MAG: uncharacterized protein JWM26_34 [Betaproteobacteria bacterium]|nr:uncharacterized protein [Betaproteobacteria bacterium]
MRRSTWLETLKSMAAVEEPLTPRAQQALSDLDETLFDFWQLGEKVLLTWSRDGKELCFLAIAHYEILQVSHSGLMNAILAGPKFQSLADFNRTCEVLESAAHVLRAHFEGGSEVPLELVSSLVTRYGVTLVPERAVVLIDIVGFSLRSPLEQVAMLNSLSYSVNSAYRQLASRDIHINFARTTTGDGFYIWNRARTRDASIALYKLMMLILADNTVAHRKAKDFPVPRLRTAFHVGEHYEFYQVEALNPSAFAYIVGPVTIELARMVSSALPGQIVIGKFELSEQGDAEAGSARRFVEDTAATLGQLANLSVAGDRIRNIRCYLTGPAAQGGDFTVASYEITDKHGISHSVYNAKINVHLQRADPIFLGVQHKDVDPEGGGR